LKKNTLVVTHRPNLDSIRNDPETPNRRTSRL